MRGVGRVSVLLGVALLGAVAPGYAQQDFDQQGACWDYLEGLGAPSASSIPYGNLAGLKTAAEDAAQVLQIVVIGIQSQNSGSDPLAIANARFLISCWTELLAEIEKIKKALLDLDPGVGLIAPGTGEVRGGQQVQPVQWAAIIVKMIMAVQAQAEKIADRDPFEEYGSAPIQEEAAGRSPTASLARDAVRRLDYSTRANER